jgi:hypothetical protein
MAPTRKRDEPNGSVLRLLGTLAFACKHRYLSVSGREFSMSKRIWVLGLVVGAIGCQGPEAFHDGPGGGGGSGGTGTIPIVLPGTAGTGPAGSSGAAGSPVTTPPDDGGAGIGAAGVPGPAGTPAGAAGAGAGGAGSPSGAAGSPVDAGSGGSGSAGASGGSGGGPHDAGVEALPQPTTPYSSAQWKATASITAAGTANLPPNAFDGNLATRWTTGRNQMGNETFLIDMGVSQPVSRVLIDDTTNPQDFPAAYTLEVSTNNTTFTSVKTGMGATMTDIRFATAMARYVRVRQTGTTPTPDGSWWSIDEIRIYP